MPYGVPTSTAEGHLALCSLLTALLLLHPAAFRRSMIVKRAPQRDVFRCLAAFDKETDAYCTLVPLMQQVCAYVFHNFFS